MVIEKRKSQGGGVNTPPKKGAFGNRSSFQKSPGGGGGDRGGGYSPKPGDWKCPKSSCGINNFASRFECFKCKAKKPDGAGGGGGNQKFGGGEGGAGFTPRIGDWKCPKASCGVNNFASRQECFKCKVKKPGQPGGGSPKKEVPPPPAEGAKKLKVQVVPPQKAKAEVKPMIKTTPEKTTPNKAKDNQKSNKKQAKKEKNGLNKISEASKTITKSKSRAKRLNQKLETKPRPREACEKAFKLEQELGHSGRVYAIKIADPPLSQEVVKGWSSAIETAVFSKPVEPRQFLVVFKPNANVKKELETLRKVVFAGSKITVEEKADTDGHTKAHPEIVDPFSLYVTNLHESVTKEDLKELFPKATFITPVKKHSPKLGNPTKFAFLNFETAEDALSSFKENYSALLSGNSIVMRFRRVTTSEMVKAAKAAPVVSAKKAEPKPKVQTPKVATPVVKKEPLKVEPESDDDDEDDDDDDEDDDEEGIGMPMAMGDDDDDDDEEDDEGEMEGVQAEEDDDDEDDDDDDEEDDDEDDDDDDDDDDDE